MDHPRLRGDHGQSSSAWSVPSGSPPLTRGPQSDANGYASVQRITPAYAGTTPRGRGPCSGRPDHPRLRGDHSSAFSMSFDTCGSPPLTRGPPTSSSPQMGHFRITPAYAGTTASIRPSHRRTWDHPRLRGDHPSFKPLETHSHGSPPLTRGPH